MIEVSLSESEVTVGATVGIMRRVESVFAARAQTVPGIDADGKGWIHDIEGALAEMAVAKHLGRYWDASTRRFRGSRFGDVAEFQVRHGCRLDDHLIIRDHDDDAARFILVVGVAPTYRIVGSILGSDAKAEVGWRRDPGGRGKPCWFVPQSALEPPRVPEPEL